MSRDELRALFHTQLRYGAQSYGYLREETPHVVRHVSTTRERGYILWSNLDENNASRVIKDELEYFSRLNQPFEWKLYSYDKPDNLMDILKQEGFTIVEPEALMVIELDSERPLLYQPSHARVTEISTQKGIQDIIDLENAIWNKRHAGLGERLIRDKQRDPNALYLYGIYEDEQMVSAAWMYIEPHSSFGSLWGGSTLPGYRGKGHYTSLLEVRAKKAVETGRSFLTVDASSMSIPILHKFGFYCLALSYGCQSPSRPIY